MVTLPERLWGVQISKGERNKVRRDVLGKVVEKAWTFVERGGLIINLGLLIRFPIR
jgi:hypothetical protein